MGARALCCLALCSVRIGSILVSHTDIHIHTILSNQQIEPTNYWVLKCVFTSHMYAYYYVHPSTYQHVAETFDCLSFTIEMPYKDTANQPCPIQVGRTSTMRIMSLERRA